MSQKHTMRLIFTLFSARNATTQYQTCIQKITDNFTSHLQIPTVVKEDEATQARKIPQTMVINWGIPVITNCAIVLRKPALLLHKHVLFNLVLTELLVV